MMEQNTANRIAGCVYGQFIGDALGTRYEFASAEGATRSVNEDMKAGFLHIKGEGPFDVLPGQVTDDTELASALLHSLIRKGTYDREDIAQGYIRWYKSNPFDIGTTTSGAFRHAVDYATMVENSTRRNDHSLSNGCLMRISPLAVYGLRLSDAELVQKAQENCRMTNPNELTQDAVAVYCVALKAALEGDNKGRIFRQAYDTSKNETIRSILRDSRTSGSRILHPNEGYVKTDGSGMGYCGIALQNTFYELMNGTSYHDSLVDIIKRGGDTDTNGCIAGALLGAYYGINRIPDPWIRSVKILNPRVERYPDVDQLHLDSHIKHLVEVVLQ